MHGFHKSPRRKSQEPHCPICGRSFVRSLTGRTREFCSERCRMQARYSDLAADLHHGPELENKSLYGPLIESTARNDAKSACAARGGKTVRTSLGRGIIGPRKVLETELATFQGWTETVSSDGVRSLVSRVRPRSLVRS